MSPDDPRHGTYAGAVAHWLGGPPICQPCKTAETRYRKTRKLRALRGDYATVPAIGTVRRVRALFAIGWTGPQIAEACGVSVNTLRSIEYRHIEHIHAATATKVRAGYERLSMSVPTGTYANRSRIRAAKRGWPPPLAWDDDRIEDPDYEPHGWRYVPADRADHLADLDERQAGISEVCAELGIRRDSVERWCERNGMRDMYVRFMERETPYVERRNQWSA